MGHKLRGSQGNYFDYHDIIAIAKNYMACDWSRGNVSKVANLTNKVEDQAETIKKLSEELEQYRTQNEKKEGQLEERIRTQVEESFNARLSELRNDLRMMVEAGAVYHITKKRKAVPGKEENAEMLARARTRKRLKRT
jgi:ABC-type phosphate transport system auxiliary subunit